MLVEVLIGRRGMAAFAGRDVSKLKAKGGGKFKYMSEKDMVEIAAPFSPYRSLFMWYMWRWENVDVAVMQAWCLNSTPSLPHSLYITRYNIDIHRWHHYWLNEMYNAIDFLVSNYLYMFIKKKWKHKEKVKVTRVDRSVICKHWYWWVCVLWSGTPFFFFFFGEPSLVLSYIIPPVHSIIDIDRLAGWTGWSDGNSSLDDEGVEFDTLGVLTLDGLDDRGEVSDIL